MPIRLSEHEARLPAVSAATWRQRLADGETMVGLWVVSGSPLVAEIVGAAGADWIIVDAEHSPNAVPSVVEQLRALEAAPVFTVVRTPSQEPKVLGQYLDIGVRGLLVPMVESAAQARAVVAATRYPPAGTRGVGGGFARAARWGGITDYLARADESIAVLVQIESAAAIEALDEILDVEGVDGAFIGPADLAGSLGHLGEPRHPEMRAVIEQGIRSIVARGRIAGVNAFALADAVGYRELGAQLLAVGADVSVLGVGASELVARVHSADSTKEK
jgi:4-hydroxy-2-oxoheptanedioate aldolase